ncbi:transmembrane emp24 domain-containing protein 2 [Scaptodrosophila lebanonensis]|uniref:Transmembrane emp24 domain-containing protein 2 n=1 Tax=Drosophila lebanonensis TaxID=7225 RepID=A0A6J2TK64_DROLE|nr:transmembrane emp24 domain-containing protein 2 [Scaptodrosophila lebanonensis]
MLFYLILWLLPLLPHTACGFTVTVDAHETVCFFDMAHVNDKLSISFEVMEGGFLDIAVRITGPNEDVLYQANKETTGIYTFTAIQNGSHTLCFDNRRSTLTPKIVMFQLKVIRALSYYIDPSLRHDDVMEQVMVQEMVNILSGKMLAVKQEQEYMHVRYTGHQGVSENTHFRVVAWSMLGPTMLLLMTVVEVYYLKRFFEVRRIV